MQSLCKHHRKHLHKTRYRTLLHSKFYGTAIDWAKILCRMHWTLEHTGSTGSAIHENFPVSVEYVGVLCHPHDSSAIEMPLYGLWQLVEGCWTAGWINVLQQQLRGEKKDGAVTQTMRSNQILDTETLPSVVCNFASCWIYPWNISHTVPVYLTI